MNRREPEPLSLATSLSTVSLARRLGLLSLTSVQLALQVATWVSLVRRDARDINGPKWFWLLASFVNFVGPVAYLLGGRKLTASR